MPYLNLVQNQTISLIVGNTKMNYLWPQQKSRINIREIQLIPSTRTILQKVVIEHGNYHRLRIFSLHFESLAATRMIPMSIVSNFVLKHCRTFLVAKVVLLYPWIWKACSSEYVRYLLINCEVNLQVSCWRTSLTQWISIRTESEIKGITLLILKKSVSRANISLIRIRMPSLMSLQRGSRYLLKFKRFSKSN